ncbi:OLC1v1013072C1 [Oldenlandia corymbosa var. corymbosa]|uniref:OLC1v1013072C1 n=1 Tax=Oldenlandia corymbosa var. corymbosa TaxID=529605 RepID=A0AAV1E0P6_OLDCO|nr:OLC1v1013072C1 [Oldenlandia corymbosa var. corymbosa]
MSGIPTKGDGEKQEENLFGLLKVGSTNRSIWLGNLGRHIPLDSKVKESTFSNTGTTIVPAV